VIALVKSEVRASDLDPGLGGVRLCLVGSDG
jgi:hypothetical protein